MSAIILLGYGSIVHGVTKLVQRCRSDGSIPFQQNSFSNICNMNTPGLLYSTVKVLSCYGWRRPAIAIKKMLIFSKYSIDELLAT